MKKNNKKKIKLTWFDYLIFTMFLALLVLSIIIMLYLKSESAICVLDPINYSSNLFNASCGCVKEGASSFTQDRAKVLHGLIYDLNGSMEK